MPVPLPVCRVRSVIQLHLAAVCLARAGPAAERNVLPGAMLDLRVAAGAALTAVFVAQVVNRYDLRRGWTGSRAE